MAKRRPDKFARIVRLLLMAVAAWVGVTVLAVVAMRWVDPPTTTFMLRDRIDGLLDEQYEFRHEWRDWDQVSKYMPLAVVASEDQRFPFHPGFDFKQIDKALADRERGRRVRGASTLSQQVAKNLFLWPGQSWFRKGLEAGITVLIELAWPKRRILEVYLNVAEFGRGTWGVQAASRRYFRKDASRLTEPEAALLAAVLPSPKRYRADAPGPYLRKRQAWIQRQMSALGGPAYLANLD
ncbi:MAG: monofunctional biosynthetic peptidoglycan transglycosylase [Steroidobacteraceae bacterium]|nr:monofunctional biosynthetic peptidoglycan transglycosylase [Steroidobacteraceae bacterium]